MGGHGEHAAPLGLYWTVGKEKTREDQKQRIYEQEETSVQQVPDTFNIQNRANAK